jgi:hypothetical protein
MDPLQNDETLGGAGVAQDGSATLDVLLADLTAVEVADLGSLLVEAAVFGDVDLAVAVIGEGANLEWKPPTGTHGRTALYIAVAHGNTDVARVIMESGGDKEATDEYGKTALFVSAYFGRLESLSLLITSGADIEARADDGDTALLVAARCGHHSCVQLLLNAGANKYAVSNDGQTLLMLAGQHSDFTPNQRTRLMGLFEA